MGEDFSQGDGNARQDQARQVCRRARHGRREMGPPAKFYLICGRGSAGFGNAAHPYLGWVIRNPVSEGAAGEGT